MEIVPVDQIPKTENIGPTPADDLVKLYNTFRQMEQICRNDSGIGLSAVQVGIPWKSFIIRFGDTDEDNHFRHFVDCEYESSGDPFTSQEGCLSLRDESGKLLHYIVQRHPKVRVTGKELISEDTLELKEIDEEWEGLYAVVFQHEIDHHHGILISDTGMPINVW